MTVRMSVPGPVRVIANSDTRQWGKYGGHIGPRPIQFTLDDHSGLANELLQMLAKAPAGRIPRKIADFLLAWRVDLGSGCPLPQCEGDVHYLLEGEIQHYDWIPSSGFTINGKLALQPTADRPKGVVIGCECGFECKPWSGGGVRPRLRIVLDLEFVEDNCSLPYISSQKRKDGSLKLGINDDGGWYSITDKGRRFLECVDEGSAIESIQSAVSSYCQLSESVNKPEILTTGSMRNTIEASLTEGPVFRDYAIFLLDSEGLDREEDRLFHALYGQNFEKVCDGCTLNQILGCSILQHLGTTASSDGCRPNLNIILEQYRNGVIRWNEYTLNVRGKVKTGFRRLETTTGKEICSMEWTHQVDKETSLLKFVTEGAGWVTAGSRDIPSIPIINERMLPNVESFDYRRKNDNNGEWAPSSGLLFCMGLEGG